MDASTPATACIAAPEWFWFGLLLLLLFTLPVAPSQSTLSTLTCLGHHNILASLSVSQITRYSSYGYLSKRSLWLSPKAISPTGYSNVSELGCLIRYYCQRSICVVIVR